jgi:hypothetical protein
MPRIEAISRRGSGQPGGCATVLIVGFLGIFVAAGAGAGYFQSARPLYLAYRARDWTPTACQVVSSRVVSSEKSSRPDIVYRYDVDGRRYTANRYDFLSGTNSDSTVPDVVASHPAGASVECFVDPDDPSSAVLNRTPTRWYFIGLAFFALFSGIPAVIGLVLLSASRRRRAAASTPAAARAGGGDSRFGSGFGVADARPLVLEASSSPLGKLVGVTIVCLLWNGLVGAFTYFEIRSFIDGQPIAWFLALFLLLFQAVGLFLLGAVPYQLLALANPRPIVTLSRGTLPLGEAVSFTWALSGAAHRVTALQMTVRGTEEARYRRGTDTQTDTHVFLTETIVDATHAPAIARGSGTIRIPAGSMHTFTAAHNKVMWTLQVTGTIARWPDMDETFDLTVGPA